MCTLNTKTLACTFWFSLFCSVNFPHALRLYSKMLLHIIKRRLTPLAETKMSENQLGFREGSGTRDAICQTWLLAERMISNNRKILACFIDYKEAIDKVNHNKLFQVLTKYDVPSEKIRLIVNLYWSKTTQIRERSEDS